MADAPSVLAAYPAADFSSPTDALARVVGDGQFVSEARRLERLVELNGDTNLPVLVRIRNRRPLPRPRDPRRGVEHHLWQQLRAPNILERTPNLLH